MDSAGMRRRDGKKTGGILGANRPDCPQKGGESAQRQGGAVGAVGVDQGEPGVVDGEVADSEREVLRGAVRGLTDGSVRTHHIQKLFEKCDELVKQGIDKRIAAIAPTLKEDPALSEAAFSLASAIAFADSEIKDEENDLINELAGALDIDGDRAEELLNQLEADSE